MVLTKNLKNLVRQCERALRCGGGRLKKKRLARPRSHPFAPSWSFLLPQKHIDFALNSPFGGGRPGRVKRKSQASKGGGGGGDGGDDDEE